jgi:hypothetical protein
MEKGIQEQERELLEGYRQLGQESKRLIMSTVITAVTAESAIKRQYGLPVEDCQVGAVSRFAEGEINLGNRKEVLV